jgi:hypothetical protein
MYMGLSRYIYDTVGNFQPLQNPEDEGSDDP